MKFSIKRLHEDYGLIPLVLYYANTITSLNNIGYHYIKRDGSITKTNDYQKFIDLESNNLKAFALEKIMDYQQMEI